MLAHGSDADIIGDNRSAVSGVHAAGIVSTGVDRIAFGKHLCFVGGKDSVGSLALRGKVAVGYRSVRVLSSCKEDGVDPVEIAVVSVGVVPGLMKCPVGYAENTTCLNERGVLIRIRCSDGGIA